MPKPATEQDRKFMTAVAQGLDEVFNPGEVRTERKIGFALLIFPFGEINGTTVNYVGNGDRRDVLESMKTIIARWESDAAGEGK